MSSISPANATPSSVQLTPAKPPTTGPGSPVDKDGDHDGGAPEKVSAAKAPGTGTVVDIKA